MKLVRLAGRWLWEQIVWAWCAVRLHPLTVPYKAQVNNRFGRSALIVQGRECRCGAKYRKGI